LAQALGRSRREQVLLIALLLLAVLFVASRGLVADIGIYRQYAEAFLRHGSFPREYPPLALVPMLLAHAIAAMLHVRYAFAFIGLEAAALLAVTLVAGRPLLLLALLPLGPVLLGTYDLWPILCLVLSYRLLERRPALSWLLLGTAIALKLFPILLIPLWWQRSRRGWGYLLLPLLTLYPPAMASVLRYQFARQAEWESTVSLLSAVLTPAGMVLRHAFGSMEFYSALSNRLSLLLDAVYVLVFAWIAFWRRDLSLERRMLLLLSLWFLTNKVLSAQYVEWVVCLGFAADLALLPLGLLGWTTALLYPWLSAAVQFAQALGDAPGVATTLRVAMSLVGLRFAVWLWAVAALLTPGGRAGGRGSPGRPGQAGRRRPLAKV